MSYSQPLQKLNINLPESLETICRKYHIEVSVSRALQAATADGYGVADWWSINLFIITDVCRDCGEIRHRLGRVPDTERCFRHSWQRSKPMLVVQSVAPSLDAAIIDAEMTASKFLQTPEDWDWHIELFLNRKEYIDYNRTLRASAQEFFSIYEELGFNEQKTLLKFARTLMQSDKGRVFGGE